MTQPMSAAHQKTSEGVRPKTRCIVRWTHTMYPPVPCVTPFGRPVVPEV